MKKINSFKDFKKYIKEKGGVWSTSGVYFSQMRDCYVAYYMPNYPDMSPDDVSVVYDYVTEKLICNKYS